MRNLLVCKQKYTLTSLDIRNKPLLPKLKYFMCKENQLLEHDYFNTVAVWYLEFVELQAFFPITCNWDPHAR